MLTSNKNNQNIVFIFSQPRSGTTLLQRMLTSHSDIVSVSETWLLLPQFLALKKRGLIAQYNHTIGYLAMNWNIKFFLYSCIKLDGLRSRKKVM